MSTCDHICRECGQVMNCQHCKPWQLPTDRARIAELEALVSEMHASGLRLEFTHEWYVSGVRRDPGTYVLMRIGPAKEAETPF